MHAFVHGWGLAGPPPSGQLGWAGQGEGLRTVGQQALPPIEVGGADQGQGWPGEESAGGWAGHSPPLF